MPDETRRAIVTAGMAGAAAALAPWGRRAWGETLAKGDAMVGTPRTVELPGFFDLQVNGFAGVTSATRPSRRSTCSTPWSAIGRTGVTRFLPTLITSSFETFSACARTIARTSASGDRRDPHGGTLYLAGGRAPRRPPPRVRARRRRRRLPPAPGGRRRSNPSPDGGSRGPGCAEGRRACSGERCPRGDRAHGRDRGPDRRRGERRRHALYAPRQRLCADAAPPPERDLGAAGGRPPDGQLHRRRPPPAAGHRDVDDPRQDAGAVHPRDRRDRRGGHAARPVHAGRAGGRALAGGSRGRPGSPEPRRLRPPARRCDRQHGEVHRARPRGRRADGLDAARRVRRLPTAGKVVAEWDPVASTLQVARIVE